MSVDTDREKIGRMPGDLRRLERVRFGLIGRRALKLERGIELVSFSGYKQAKVEATMGEVALTLDKTTRTGRIVTTQVQLTWSDDGLEEYNVPYISAQRHRVFPDGSETETDYEASRETNANTLSLHAVASTIRTIKRLRMLEPA